MEQYTYLVAALGLGAVLLVLIYFNRSRYSSKSGGRRSWLSYLFLWPLVLDSDASKSKGRLFTTREWAGWAVVALIIFCGILFGSHR